MFHRTALAALAAAALVPAQNPFEPAPQVRKLARLVGAWQGEGISRMGGQEGKWTATSSARWVLGGHFVQEDLRIDMGEYVPAPMLIRSLYGYDREHDRYVALSVSNMGPPAASRVVFLDDHTLVTIAARVSMGAPAVHRTVTRLSADAYEFTLDEASADHPFQRIVEGRFTRVKEAPGIDGVETADASYAMMPVPEEMAKLDVMLGTWKVEGKMVPMPGADAVNVTGKQICTKILGGHVLAASVLGDSQQGGPAYEALYFAGWNPDARAFRTLYADNMGVSGSGLQHWIGERTAVTIMQPSKVMGVPAAFRSVAKMAADGGSFTVLDHWLVGDAAPEKAFEATFSRISGR